jgi:hypothetical protein
VCEGGERSEQGEADFDPLVSISNTDVVRTFLESTVFGRPSTERALIDHIRKAFWSTKHGKSLAE